MREVVVDFLADLDERSSIAFSITRPLLELPGSSGYGVVWRRSVYPLHQFDGAAGHTHLEGLQLLKPEDCPVVTETVYLDGSSDRASLRGAIDMAGHVNYLFLDCPNEFIEEIVDCLDEIGLGAGGYGPGNKAARNGRIYEHFIRLRPSHLMPGSDPKASIMTALSMAGFDLVIDDFWEPGDLEELGASTKREPQPINSDLPEPPLDHAKGSLKILERNTESLLRGFELAGWSRSQVDSLSDKLRQHAFDSAPRLDSGTVDANDEVIRAIIDDERAELIGAWALDNLKQVTESATSQIEASSAKSTDLNSRIDQLTRDLSASEQLNRKVAEGPGLSTKGEVAQVEVLRSSIKEIETERDRLEKDYNALLHEHERTMEEREDLEHDRDRAHDRIRRLEAMSHNWDDTSEIVGDFCAIWGTKIELLRDSEARIASREFSDRKPLLERLLTLNNGDMPSDTHPVQGRARQKGWNTTHFPTGRKGYDGRIYYRRDGQKMRILISRKSLQDRDIDNLLYRL